MERMKGGRIHIHTNRCDSTKNVTKVVTVDVRLDGAT